MGVGKVSGEPFLVSGTLRGHTECTRLPEDGFGHGTGGSGGVRLPDV